MPSKDFDWSSTQPQIEKAGPKFVSSTTMDDNPKKPWYAQLVRLMLVAMSWLISTLIFYYMWKVIFDWWDGK